MRQSAGILLYKQDGAAFQFFLVHPGGPFWQKKDLGAWTIPKGEYSDGEEALQAAIREFYEETGNRVTGNFIPLSPVIQKSGKRVEAWALEGDIDSNSIKSNTFKMEWPYKSGRFREFPEVDKGGWFSLQEAFEKINPAQVGFLSELAEYLKEAKEKG